MPDPSLSSSEPGTLQGQRGEARSAGAGGDQLHDDLNWARATRDPGLLDAALRLVTSLARATVSGADGVSVTLMRSGEMATVAASDETVRRMDEHQYATSEGPCLAAAADGHSYHSDFLLEEERWPAFVPRAVEEGIASILSTPVLVSNLSVGALNIYSRTGGSFGPVEREVAALFAAHAADILGEVAVLDEHHGLRITEALTAREVIAMAQGVHMARLGVSAEAAAGELYQAARAKEITVRAEALAVLSSIRDAGPAPDGVRD